MRKGKIKIGYIVGTPYPYTYYFALSAALNRFASSFVLEQTGILSKVTMYVHSVNGTLGANDLVCDLYSDVNGSPGVLLESVNTVTAIPTGAGRIEFTGFSYVLYEGVRYWLVVRNVNASPAVNYASLIYHPDDTGVSDFAGGSSWGWTKAESTDGGTTFANFYYQQSFLRVELQGSVFEGLPIDSVGIGDTATETVYGNRMCGIKFVVPAVDMKVIGAMCYFAKGGSPTGDARIRVFNNETLLDETNVINKNNCTGWAWRYAKFPNALTIPAGSTLRVVLSETANLDDYWNRYYLAKQVLENNVNTLALKPFQGTLQRTYYDGSSWTDMPTELTHLAILLDADEPFPTPISGGPAQRIFAPICGGRLTI